LELPRVRAFVLSFVQAKDERDGTVSVIYNYNLFLRGGIQL